MIRLNIHETMRRLSRYLANLARGENILLCKRNTPIAEIRPLRAPTRGKRPIGLARGEFKVPKKFFQPLPSEVLGAFYGEK